MPQDLCDSFVFNAVSNIISAIVGAGAAAIPAFFLARKASTEALLRDQKIRRSAQKAAMLRATVKLTKIVNGLGGLNQHIERSIASAETGMPENPYLWSKVTPIIGLGERTVAFDADELAPLLEIGEANLLNDLLELSARYTAINEGLDTYTHRRTLLTDQLSVTMQGRVGRAGLTDEENAAFVPRFIELDSLVVQFRKMSHSYYASALDIGARFGPAAKRATDDPSFPGLDISKALSPIGPTSSV